jgi:hypothetical protein
MSIMHSPIGFGVYGEQYLPEIMDFSEDDLTPLSAVQSTSWVTPSQFSGLGSIFTTAKGAVLGVAAGVLAGVAAEQIKASIKVKHPTADMVLNYTIGPIAASVVALAAYGFFS